MSYSFDNYKILKYRVKKINQNKREVMWDLTAQLRIIDNIIIYKKWFSLLFNIFVCIRLPHHHHHLTTAYVIFSFIYNDCFLFVIYIINL